QRALDNMTSVGPATVLHVIEGISGQNGDAFTSGPGPGGTAQVFLTNFGLFHIPKERRLSTVLNPRNIPIYLWDSENPKLTPLADLEKCRRRLVTPYLAKAGEAAYHLC